MFLHLHLYSSGMTWEKITVQLHNAWETATNAFLCFIYTI